jgi:transposase InsO family protein
MAPSFSTRKIHTYGVQSNGAGRVDAAQWTKFQTLHKLQECLKNPRRNTLAVRRYRMVFGKPSCGMERWSCRKGDQLWISDFTYVSTWQGMAYVAFITDVFARKIVGWRVSTSMNTSFVLDALN